MALRPFLLLLLLLLLAATLLITQAQGIGSSALDCCLKHTPLKKEIPSRMVKSYRLQEPQSGCPLRAVVLTTKRNKKLCLSSTDDAVQKLMERLDKKAKKKGQTKHPRGRPKNQRQQQV